MLQIQQDSGVFLGLPLKLSRRYLFPVFVLSYASWLLTPGSSQTHKILECASFSVMLKNIDFNVFF